MKSLLVFNIINLPPMQRAVSVRDVSYYNEYDLHLRHIATDLLTRSTSLKFMCFGSANNDNIVDTTGGDTEMEPNRSIRDQDVFVMAEVQPPIGRFGRLGSRASIAYDLNGPQDIYDEYKGVFALQALSGT
jgi:hypothetical protein